MGPAGLTAHLPREPRPRHGAGLWLKQILPCQERSNHTERCRMWERNSCLHSTSVKAVALPDSPQGPGCGGLPPKKDVLSPAGAARWDSQPIALLWDHWLPLSSSLESPSVPCSVPLPVPGEGRNPHPTVRAVGSMCASVYVGQRMWFLACGAGP